MSRADLETSGRHRVIVTAGDADLRRALRFLLQVEGYAVDALDSGAALLASAQSQADCLVVDQDLPGVSGLDALRALRRKLKTPAVLLVGDADRKLRAEARQARVELVVKPFHGGQLLALVRSALEP